MGGHSTGKKNSSQFGSLIPEKKEIRLLETNCKRFVKNVEKTYIKSRLCKHGNVKKEETKLHKQNNATKYKHVNDSSLTIFRIVSTPSV